MELFHPNIPLQPRPSGCFVPLTAVQQRVFNRFIKRGTTLSDLRMCAASVRLSGPLNTDFLKESIESVVQRHEALRTRITIAGGTPTQHIDARPDYFEFVDLTNEAPEKIEKEAMLIGQEFMDRRIDLTAGPLFGAKLLRLSDHDHFLIMALDHLISDAGSYVILNREIWALYQQAVHERPLALSPLPIQFPDYAVWQQNTLDCWLKNHEPYWRQRLSGAPHLRLTPDSGPLATEHISIARLHFPFGKALSTKVHDVAKREKMRVPLVVLTIYLVVMSRWFNQRDLILTFVSHGRHDHPDLTSMVGILAHFLHLRIEIGNKDNFLDLAKQADLEFRAAHQHRDFGRVPDLFPECATDLHFNWLPNGGNWSIDTRQGDDQAVTARPVPLRVNWHPEFLPLFSDTASGINVTVTYRPDMFTRNTVERFGRNLNQVSEKFVQNPLTRVDSIALDTF